MQTDSTTRLTAGWWKTCIITGATDQFITITDVRPGDRETYTLRATNTCGTTTSYPVNLTVLSADLGIQGGLPGSDGLFDNNDFIAFINLYFDNCPRVRILHHGPKATREGDSQLRVTMTSAA